MLVKERAIQLNNQSHEHALAGFLKEASLVIGAGFASDLSRSAFFKLIKSLWEIKYSFRVLGEDEIARKLQEQRAKVSAPSDTTKSLAYTFFLSRSAALLTTAFVAERVIDPYLDLAKILFRVKEGFQKHHKDLSKISLIIGGKEEGSKAPILALIIENFSTQGSFQAVDGKKGKIRVKPSILPELSIVQTSYDSGLASSYRTLFYLVGSDALQKTTKRVS